VKDVEGHWLTRHWNCWNNV